MAESPHINISRTVNLPDEVRVERALRAPDLGPRILFFSGGTALRRLSRELVRYTHNSIHIITPFDSGGSSAELRKAFGMLAVGDLRNRLMALADRTVLGNPEIFRLSAYRFDTSADAGALRSKLDALCDGTDPLMARVPSPVREITCRYLGFFRERMPEDFDLRGASVGNLMLAGGYFNHDRHIDPVLYLFSQLIEARGTVRPVINGDLHLAAELADGTVLHGQHMITGKEVDAIEQPVKKLWLTADLEDDTPVETRISDKMAELIESADLICYPMGSFYTSVMANLLPKGVGSAVAAANCPKIHIPSLGNDPEALGLGLFESTQRLIQALEASAGEGVHPSRLIDFVLIDSKNGAYREPLDLDKYQRFGVQVIDSTLVTPSSAPLLDETEVIRHLISLL